MMVWTDYPLFPEEHGKIAPVRRVEVIGYDHNIYCDVLFEGKQHEIKRGYLFKRKGRVGEVACLRDDDLCKAFPITETSDGETK